MLENTRWRSRVHSGLLLMLFLGAVSCRNFYRDFSDKTSDDYLIRQTEYLINAGDYDEAIATIDPILARKPDNERVVYLASAAYAGKGGLRVLDFLSSIASDLDTYSMFHVFGLQFVGADDDAVDAIEEAFSIINTYEPDPALRPTRFNFYATFLLFSRIGVNASRYALTSTGTLDGDFDNCKESIVPAPDVGIPSAAIDIMIDSILKLPDTLANSGSESFASLASQIPSDVEATENACADPGQNGQSPCLLMRTYLGAGKEDGGIGFNVVPRPASLSPTVNECSGGVTP